MTKKFGIPTSSRRYVLELGVNLVGFVELHHACMLAPHHAGFSRQPRPDRSALRYGQSRGAVVVGPIIRTKPWCSSSLPYDPDKGVMLHSSGVS